MLLQCNVTRSTESLKKESCCLKEQTSCTLLLVVTLYNSFLMPVLYVNYLKITAQFKIKSFSTMTRDTGKSIFCNQCVCLSLLVQQLTTLSVWIFM